MQQVSSLFLSFHVPRVQRSSRVKTNRNRRKINQIKVTEQQHRAHKGKWKVKKNLRCNYFHSHHSPLLS